MSEFFLPDGVIKNPSFPFNIYLVDIFPDLIGEKLFLSNKLENLIISLFFFYISHFLF